MGVPETMGDEESKCFTLAEAERTRVECEPILVEAIDARRKMVEFEDKLRAISERILRSGGMQVPYDQAAKWRNNHDRFAEQVGAALERIQSTGCLVKDLDVGLLDFPARLNNEEIYFCWRLGEDRIRFYHRQDEGFSGRKPLDPRDKDHQLPTQ
ncbi:MAG: DUF2203 domain-containing protein [Candidatus Acidiferrales bacterium]